MKLTSKLNNSETVIQLKLNQIIEWDIPMNDYAKDGGKELFTKMYCVL